MATHYWNVWRFWPKLFLSLLFVFEPLFFWSLHFFNLFLPLSLTILLFSYNLLSFGLFFSFIFDCGNHFLAAESQRSQVFFLSIVFDVMSLVDLLQKRDFFLLELLELLFPLLCLHFQLHLVFLTSWINWIKLLFPVVNVSLLGFLRLDGYISLPLSLLFLHRSFTILEDRAVLLWQAFELPGLVEFNKVDGFEYVVHLLFVNLSVGMVAFPELLDVLWNGCNVFVFLANAIPTSEVILLISTFFRIMSSVMLLCLEIESFSFCSWLRSRLTRLRIRSRSFLTCLNSTGLIPAS